MKKHAAIALTLAALLSGCAMTGMNSRTGYAAIMMAKEAGEVTGKKIGTKTGKSCSQNILGLIAMGDSTVVSAMRKGDITELSTVDYHYESYLGLYGRVCTVVTGN